MPELGELMRGHDLGHKDNHLYIWRACVECGRREWTPRRNGKPTSDRCRSCRSKLRWEKTRRPLPTNDGYVLIRLDPGDFFYPMTDHRGYVREHRLIMAKSLGRCLHAWEIVHHRNGNKSDNKLQNLQVISELGHRQITILEKKISELEARVEKLEVENQKLRNQNQ